MSNNIIKWAEISAQDFNEGIIIWDFKKLGDLSRSQ